MVLQCRRKTIERATWEVRPQGRNLKELAGEHTRGAVCGSIGFNAVNLTRGDSTVMVSLKGLPEALRGIAWPSSARAVKPLSFTKKDACEKKLCASCREKREGLSRSVLLSQATSKTRAVCC